MAFQLTSTSFRRLELGILALVVLVQLLFWGGAGLLSSTGAGLVADIFGSLLLASFFGLPILLALLGLASVLVDGVGIGTLVVIPAALLALFIISLSVLALVSPPEGGGVYGGHFFSALSLVYLLPAILLRAPLNRLFSRFWFRRD